METQTCSKLWSLFCVAFAPILPEGDVARFWYWNTPVFCWNSYFFCRAATTMNHCSPTQKTLCAEILWHIFSSSCFFLQPCIGEKLKGRLLKGSFDKRFLGVNFQHESLMAFQIKELGRGLKLGETLKGGWDGCTMYFVGKPFTCTLLTSTFVFRPGTSHPFQGFELKWSLAATCLEGFSVTSHEKGYEMPPLKE